MNHRPAQPVPAGSDDAAERILDVLPESRKRGYEVRKIIECLADRDTFLELKPTLRAYRRGRSGAARRAHRRRS